MKKIVQLQPKRIVFGDGVSTYCADDVLAAGLHRFFIVTSPPVQPLTEPLAEKLRAGGASVAIYAEVAGEPSITTLDAALSAARAFSPDGVIGIGGGSALDVAKLVACFYNGAQNVRQTFGTNILAGRSLHLACLPTTAGTGSEVSPNAILLDEREHLKKAVVSPHVVPDAAYIDPLLTLSLPPAVTAATGMDALTHCIEAYVSVNAHPIGDLYDLQGIRLIGASLERAVTHGDDREARGNMALGSLYGGLTLGSVNTGAVHALAYPLGGEFHIAHGVSNAVLLPAVLAYNLPAASERYAEVALALGVQPADDMLQTAERGIERIREMMRNCRIPMSLSQLEVPEAAIPAMAQAAMKVTRLLKNNVRPLDLAAAEAIYRAAF